jgi:DNA-binding response OmpR family regulator
MRILLIEDQDELSSRIALHVMKAGFEVDRVDSIKCALEALRAAPYVLSILDRRLPDGDGVSIMPDMRKLQPGIRILVLSALDALDDRIEGLDAGADDYLTKPIHLDELIARIRASLRRPGATAMPPVRLGGVVFDLESASVSINGEPAVFHRRELALLESLMRRAGRVVRRPTLLAEIYGFEEEIQPHALTILVSRLRQKLDELDAGVDIHPARGVGYLLKSSKA